MARFVFFVFWSLDEGGQGHVWSFVFLNVFFVDFGQMSFLYVPYFWSLDEGGQVRATGVVGFTQNLFKEIQTPLKYAVQPNNGSPLCNAVSACAGACACAGDPADPVLGTQRTSQLGAAIYLHHLTQSDPLLPQSNALHSAAWYMYAFPRLKFLFSTVSFQSYTVVSLKRRFYLS